MNLDTASLTTAFTPDLSPTPDPVIRNADGRVVGERGMVPNRATRRANARATRPPRNPRPGQRLPVPAPLTDPDWQRKMAEARLPQLMARQIDVQRRALARARKESA